MNIFQETQGQFPGLGDPPVFLPGEPHDRETWRATDPMGSQSRTQS